MAFDPAAEWTDAFRRTRNALLCWLVIGAPAVLAVARSPFESRAGKAAFMIFWFASACVLLGLWRAARLWMIRRDLDRTGQPLGRVFVALVHNPLPRNVFELVAVWVDDPRTEAGRLRRPDHRYMADLSEDDRCDAFARPTVREAWTPVRPDGHPRRGRWFATADNLILTVRRGGPFLWLATVRGWRSFTGIVPADQPDLSAVSTLRAGVGFTGLARALMWRLLGAAAIGGVGVVAT